MIHLWSVLYYFAVYALMFTFPLLFPLYDKGKQYSKVLWKITGP